MEIDKRTQPVNLDKSEIEITVRNINDKFRNGGTAYDAIKDIRKFPRPIAVDFNNVIANNRAPLELNPDAPAFLENLRQIGNVFIVTSASGWDSVQSFLEEHGLWTDDIVLMTGPTYKFISQWQQTDPRAKKIREDFLEMAEGLGWNYQESDLFQPPGFKRIAQIFCKPFEVPLIDDSYAATDNNPGILGIMVQHWGKEDESLWANSNNLNPTLAEAVEIVREHYKNINLK